MESPQKTLDRLGFKALKKLGQNFLVNAASAEKIFKCGMPPAGMPVLEIGPGLGALSFWIAQNGHPLYLVEKDSRLMDHLNDSFPEAHLFNADFLKWDLAAHMPEGPFYVYSNLPYQVATPILEKLFRFRSRIVGMCFLMQREMADRICASPGVKNYGRLSIWAQSICEVKSQHIVSGHSFYPAPQVGSRVITLSPKASIFNSQEEEETFFTFVATLFVKRRKMLRSILKETLKSHPELREMDTLLSQRPEDLSIAQLVDFFRRVI